MNHPPKPIPPCPPTVNPELWQALHTTLWPRLRAWYTQLLAGEFVSRKHSEKDDKAA